MTRVKIYVAIASALFMASCATSREEVIARNHQFQLTSTKSPKEVINCINEQAELFYRAIDPRMTFGTAPNRTHNSIKEGADGSFELSVIPLAKTINAKALTHAVASGSTSRDSDRELTTEAVYKISPTAEGSKITAYAVRSFGASGLIKKHTTGCATLVP